MANKYITIATDISSSNTYKMSTWACYIRTPRGTIKHVGLFKDWHENSHYLETLALANALVIAEKNCDLSQHQMIIYNEIEYVLRPLTTKKAGLPKLKDAERTRIIEEVMMPILEQCITWELRDVKAHTKEWKKPTAAKKYILNRWCDIESRRLLRKHVNLVRKPQRNRSIM